MIHSEFEELMSLRLDSMISDSDEHRLNVHLSECSGCAQAWASLYNADDLLRASALDPLPVPSTLLERVMAQIAAPVYIPQTAAAREPLGIPASTGRLRSIPGLQGVGVPRLSATATGRLVSLSAGTRRLVNSPTMGLADTADWQKRTVSYLRSTAAVFLTLAGAASLFLALTMSGVIKLEGALGDSISTLRTIFEAVGAWLQSAFATSGSAFLAGGVLVVGLLLLVGWQVVNGYQRSILENRGRTGALTGGLNTGSLEAAA